jgi:hypothetical protein
MNCKETEKGVAKVYLYNPQTKERIYITDNSKVDFDSKEGYTHTFEVDLSKVKSDKDRLLSDLYSKSKTYILLEDKE